MKHSVKFRNCENHWDNALPFGNGVFGCMLFYEKGCLHMPMNHYEVYYNISHPLLPEDKLEAMGDIKDAGAEHRRRRKQADESQPGEDKLTCLFRSSRESVLKNKSYGIFKFSESFPQTGELIFAFGREAREQELALYLEDARGVLTLDGTRIETVVTRRDCIINTVRQGDIPLESVTVSFPDYRDCEPPLVDYRQRDAHTVTYTVRRQVAEDKTCVFTGILRFSGAEVRLEREYDNSAVIAVTRSKPVFKILTGVFTDWQYRDTDSSAVSGIDRYEAEADKLLNEHSEYYREFFNRSSISLPDKFLEKIYLINQYALDCCSGKDGVMKHQSCGLNGLWAIRHPNLWGSKWYWDVNIQAAFAGVFSSNRLDLARVFSDGLLSYAESAQRHAKEVHGMSGMSIDYPYDFYYSCFVWCAQYMWYLYEYSLDTDYLRDKAYPVFLQLCEFSLQLFEYDSERGVYVVYPDVSPEQGPLTHNSVITVACVKYLLSFTLEAAEILGDTSPLLNEVRHMLARMPQYPVSRDLHLKDSEDADDNTFIRHPSMLMPVFPIGEIGLHSDSETKELIERTLDYLEDRCEIGIFGGSWLSAAAARLGKGQRALRYLYERGIDHMLRTNGLTAEETDRFINYCLIARQPLYYPCMMEFSGEMLAAVNEMLLQSYGGVIRVFPALPDGDPEYERYKRQGYYLGEYLKLRHEYPAWNTVGFTRLLAKGAFEVSARLEEGVLVHLEVKSLKGGVLRLTSPYLKKDTKVFCRGAQLPIVWEGDAAVLDTKEGVTYFFAEASSATEDTSVLGYDSGVDTHMTYTKRLISVGEDSETAYRRKLDGAMRDWYYGNLPMSNHTVYKFDFTREAEKDYASHLPPQAFDSRGIVMGGMDFVRTDGAVFTHKAGYGFDRRVDIVKRDGPDSLRCDLAQSDKAAEFIIEMPRGQYELLVISGDSAEDSVTAASVENSRCVGGKIVRAGEFQCELIPVVSEYDEPIRLKLSTREGYRWKLNALIINAVKGY